MTARLGHGRRHGILGAPLAAAAALLLNVGLPALPAAGTLKVSPVKVTLPSDGRAEIIRLQNPEPTTTLVQIEAIEWAEAEDLDAAKPSPAILAVPPVFELGPRQEQMIRLALRRPQRADSGHARRRADVERAYRLLITEVPEEVDDSGVAFAVRLNLPLFVTPRGAAPAPRWRLRTKASGESELVLANDGSAHLLVKSLELKKPGGAETLFASTEPAYALARGEQRWSLGYDWRPPPGPLEVSAETHLGPKQAPVSTP